jgi:hypothetical protein
LFWCIKTKTKMTMTKKTILIILSVLVVAVCGERGAEVFLSAGTAEAGASGIEDAGLGAGWG